MITDDDCQKLSSCSFCGKSQDQVQRMVAGPGNMFICDECIDLHRKKIEEQYAPLPPNLDQNTSLLPKTTTSNTLHICSFCGKSQDQVQHLVAGTGNCYVCDECVDLRRKALELAQHSQSPNEWKYVKN